MTDANQGGATALHRAVVRRVSNASVLAVVGLILSGLLFQVSSIAFDYMKVRGFPLYASASSLPRFAASIQQIDREMEPNAGRIRELLRDRATIDLDIAAKKEDAEITLSQAKTFLRPIASVELNFTAIDEMFQAVCAPAENAAAAVQTAELSPTTPVGAGETPPRTSPPEADAARVLPLTPAQRALLAPACHISEEPCSVTAARGVRHRMICAQQALQTALRRKTAVTNYDFDDAKYMSDALRVTYPSFSAEQVVAAAEIAEIYNTTVNGPAGSCACCGAVEAGGKAAPACPLWGKVHRAFWNWALSWPLAMMYLGLAFVFGLLGALARYLYRFAAPVENPRSNPMEPVLAGGGAAVLMLMIVMAGFQFLTVGANSPDLAYPNPLTVGGLGVLSGLAGERVLAALQNIVSRIFPGGTPPEHPTR